MQGGFRFPRALANRSRRSDRRRCPRLPAAPSTASSAGPETPAHPAGLELSRCAVNAAAWATLWFTSGQNSGWSPDWAGREFHRVARASDTLFLSRYPVIICLQLNPIEACRSLHPPKTAAAYFKRCYRNCPEKRLRLSVITRGQSR